MCRCNYFEPNCFGCISRGHCCCLTSESRLVDCQVRDPDDLHYCCLLCAEDTELANAFNDCSCYRRCCCVELIWHPCNTGYLAPLGQSKILAKDGTEVLGDVFPCLSTSLLSFLSCYCSCSGCLSCFSLRQCCCLKQQVVACKPMCNTSDRSDPHLQCICCKNSCLVVNPLNCSCLDQCCCCLDHRCALCPTSEVACLWVPCLFCVACVDCQCIKPECCKDMKTIRKLSTYIAGRGGGELEMIVPTPVATPNSHT
ncbi:hypothetical protein EON64_14400, partial [archaeon]